MNSRVPVVGVFVETGCQLRRSVEVWITTCRLPERPETWRRTWPAVPWLERASWRPGLGTGAVTVSLAGGMVMVPSGFVAVQW